MTRRLLLTYLSFALLILAGLEVPLGFLQQRNEQRQAFAQLEHDTEVLAAYLEPAVRRDDMSRVDVLARETGERLGGYVDIVDAAGVPLFSTQPAPGRPIPSADVEAVLGGEGRVSFRIAGSGAAATLSVTVQLNPGIYPRGAVRVSVPASTVRRHVERFWLLLAAGGLLALVAAAAIAFALARWISRPVRALEQATRGLADGVAPPPPAAFGPPELRSLARTFADTADRLQLLIASQRSFIGHASHQLKTPLAALRLRLENLEPDVAAGGAANLRAALVETDRLARLVETLLALARSDQRTPPREPVALAGAVDERVSFWTPLAAAQDVRLAASGPPDAHVLAVSGAVDQILDNLLSNALRVAPRGSTIAVSWRAEASTVEVHVVDEGPGLTADQRLRALDPFWRAPGTVPGGTGLGLSLVRKLAEASGGGAELRAGRGGGLDAVVVLPADEARVTIGVG